MTVTPVDVIHEAQPLVKKTKIHAHVQYIFLRKTRVDFLYRGIRLNDAYTQLRLSQLKTIHL